MGRRVLNLLIFLALLTPSAHYVWQNRDMPQFAYLHDDGMLFVTAKSVAQGSYRIDSFPEEPAQTKFPPLYPLYLSAIWKINPSFPDNLRLGTLFAWIPLAALLLLAWRLYRKMGFSEPRTWLLVALLGFNPYVLVFGSMMFSDVFFTCWLLAVLLAIESEKASLAITAALLAACAYLSRTAGVALLVSVPVGILWKTTADGKRDWRKAAMFAGAMLPAIIGWTVWTRTHTRPTTDLTLLYYTDYMRYLMRFDLHVLPTVIWKNFDQMLYALGSLVLPRVVDAYPMKILTQVVGIAMVTGTVRMVRRGVGTQYAWFALISMGILLIWNFPPTERFVLPLFPLFLAGFVVEIEHLGKMLMSAFRKKEIGERVVASGFLAVVVGILGAGLALQCYMTFIYPAEDTAQRSSKLRDQRAAYQWISANLPPSAEILSYDDPLMYLYTGRRGHYLPLDPLWWYTEDHTAIRSVYKHLAAYCRERGLEYVYVTSHDLERETGDEDREAVQNSIRENRELTQVFQAGIGTVYQVAPAPPLSLAAR